MSETSPSLASTVLISNEQRSKEERLKSRAVVEQIPMNEPNITTENNRNASQGMGGEKFLKLLKSDWWDTYKQLLRRYRIQLELAEEALERILFWMPHSDSEDPTEPQNQWREALFGLLSLHRLSMYCASQEDNEGNMGLENSYGMTIQTKEQPSISATRIRIYLSILHCLMPTLLEILPTRRNSRKNPSARQQSQSRVRLRLEQVKFGLRLYLLASYWMQQQRENQSREGESWLGTLWKNNTFNVGILQAGGMFDVVGQGSGLHSREAERLGRRQAYMGQRTGLTIRLANGNDKILPPSLSTANARSSFTSELNGNASGLQDRRQRKGQLIGIVIGELLHILRPLYWASAEAYSGIDRPPLPGLPQLSSSSLKMLKPWIETLLMDLVSLKLLWKNATKNSGNPWTYDEWKRRKGRLLLYLLRGPFWSKLTHPVLETGSSIWTKIPILGRLLDVFLWDWILYWKLPYIAEEG